MQARDVPTPGLSTYLKLHSGASGIPRNRVGPSEGQRFTKCRLHIVPRLELSISISSQLTHIHIFLSYLIIAGIT